MNLVAARSMVLMLALTPCVNLALELAASTDRVSTEAILAKALAILAICGPTGITAAEIPARARSVGRTRLCNTYALHGAMVSLAETFAIYAISRPACRGTTEVVACTDWISIAQVVRNF